MPAALAEAVTLQVAARCPRKISRRALPNFTRRFAPRGFTSRRFFPGTIQSSGRSSPSSRAKKKGRRSPTPPVESEFKI
jgi:hypothetical protein